MNSPSAKTRLFSDDGIDPSRSHCEPEYVYYPDESTETEIRHFFNALKESSQIKQNNSEQINIRDIPFRHDLSIMISGSDSDLISVEDVSKYYYRSFCNPDILTLIGTCICVHPLNLGSQWDVSCCYTFYFIS